jgi:hypothetical protein
VIARRAALVLTALAVLVFAASATASTIALKCVGKGGRYQSEANSISCGVKPGKTRTIEGVVRDDANKPVSGPVTVKLSRWIPKDGYYSVEEYDSLTVSANAAGKFSYKAKADTKITVRFEAAGISGEADVSRELQVRVAKLGGGKVRISVKGAGKAPIKMFLVDESGYPLAGTAGKRLSKAGVAIFSVGSYHGPASWVFEAGSYDDLFWTNRGPTFRI